MVVATKEGVTYTGFSFHCLVLLTNNVICFTAQFLRSQQYTSFLVNQIL